MKIAIIGTGIAGMGAAYLLHPHHEITVYEQNSVIGGHSRTIDLALPEGNIPVDTGFIVFNHRNYPHLTALFTKLQVPVTKSDMSFGASIRQGWLEYGSVGLKSLFAQKQNLLRPAYLKMLLDILKFNREAKRYLTRDTSITLGDAIAELKLGNWFRDYYLLAMGGAIWSTPLEEMLQFPASTFIRFFENHGLLTVNDQPQWYTVQGGSREYVKRLTAPFADRILTNCGVVTVTRQEDGVTLQDTQGNLRTYDRVVFACHPDQTLKMVQQTDAEEQRILGAFRYQPNRVVVHQDISFMPRHRAAWASWVYLSETRADQQQAIALSYWMNNLQPLATQQPVIITLNPPREPAHILNEHEFHHPVFTSEAIAAQREIPALQGKNHCWYVGAWQRYGFHEDGLLSAVEMAATMGITPSW
jgi:predicted NAD/FAD-binding protein